VKSIATSLVAFALTALLNTAFPQSRAGDWFTVIHSDLCVTEGTIEKAAGDRMSVDVPKMRAYVTAPSAQSIEIRFRYDGPTKKESALASGQARRQLGLKLRAQDPCNLVYAMWRIDPKSEMVVSVKRNPSQHTSAQCGNNGYTNIKPRQSAPIPHLQPGESHTLRAEMKDAELHVFADNREVWTGDVGADAAKLDGPVGIRSDNAQFEFDLKARGTDGAHKPLACKPGDSD
jgi:hypothetical protein